MRHDSDFAAYLAARWPTLVRTLVLLGAREHAAEEVAQTGLARCYASWGRVRGAHDIDAHVYRTVLDCWAKRRRRWEETPTPAVPTAEPTEQALLRGAFEAELDRLTPDLRVVLVLRFVAGLSESQVAEVLDLTVDTVEIQSELLAEDAFREAGEGIDVPPPPIEAAMAEAREHRQRKRRAVAGTVVAVLAVVGLGTWLGTRPAAPPQVPPPAVTRVESLAEVAWWANNSLHLQHVTVELPRLEDLVEVSQGAVVGDEQGGVVYVADDGSLTTLGHKVPGAPLVASDEQGWAAWVDPRDGSPELVVYDLTSRQVLARRPLPDESSQSLDEGAYPIALDGDTLYYATRDGDWEWTPPDGEPQPINPDNRLLDVATATRVSQVASETVEIVQPFFNVAFRVAGAGAQLSPDGVYVLTRSAPPGSSDPFATVLLYDARSGDKLRTGLRHQDVAVAATLGPDDEVTYVIANRDDVPDAGEFVRTSFSGPYELRTCHIGERTCFTVTHFPHTGALPVLPR